MSTPTISLGARQLFLFGGVMSSSYFFFGNLGAAYFGIIPAIDPRQNLGTTAPLSVETRVALWKWFYDRAKLHMGGSAFISFASFSAAAYLIAPGIPRNLLVVASMSSFAIIPFTLLAMIPVNNELAAAHNSGSLRMTAENKEQKTRMMERVDSWRKLHRVRLALGAGAWAIGLWVLTRETETNSLSLYLDSLVNGRH